MEAIRRAGEGLLRLVYPGRASCMGCGDRTGMEREWLCEACRQELAKRWLGPIRPPCARIDVAAGAYRYGGAARGLTQNLKYRGVGALAELMARPMARALEPLMPLELDAAVWVPMHPRRLSQRGYNHAALLAQALAGALDIPAIDALERLRDTPQQAKLDDARRRANLEGAIGAKRDMSGMRVLLVDDVCTTGATARACAEALRAAGASRVALACFAFS